MTFKKYQSHKIINATKIIKWEATDTLPDYEWVLTAEDGTEYMERKNLFARGEPQDDYFYLVKYDDDYVSWSPKDAFENGYSEIIVL